MSISEQQDIYSPKGVRSSCKGDDLTKFSVTGAAS